MYAAKIVSYAQGYMLMREAAKENGWKLNYGGVALMWRGGCIIRSRFLGKIRDAFDKEPEPREPAARRLLQARRSTSARRAGGGWWRSSAELGIPVPAMSSALAFYDGYRHGWLPANMVQAQRDYFGAHTYERIDKPRGEFFHTNWTGRGGRVASSSYTV